jgi:hypothetical protein
MTQLSFFRALTFCLLLVGGMFGFWHLWFCNRHNVPVAELWSTGEYWTLGYFWAANLAMMRWFHLQPFTDASE